MDQLMFALGSVVVSIVVLAAVGLLVGRSSRTPERNAADAVAASLVQTRRDLRPQPRWLQRLKAELGGYFWLPCPMCGEERGGHEPAGHLRVTRAAGKMVCANCADEADRLNRERFSSEYGSNVIELHIGIKPS